MPIETRKLKDNLLVNLSGSFDRQASHELETLVKDEAPTCKGIVLNLFDVNYISSVSIGTLIRLHSGLKEDKKPLVLSHVSDECQKIFDMVDLEKIVPICKSDDDALKHCGGR